MSTTMKQALLVAEATIERLDKNGSARGTLDVIRNAINKAATLTQLEFEGEDFEIAEKIAKRMGFTQTAYTSTSALWGLFCLPDRAGQRHGCIIKTQELGFLFVADLEDLGMEDLKPGASKPLRSVVAARRNAP